MKDKMTKGMPMKPSVKHVADMVNSPQHKYLEAHKAGMKDGHTKLEKMSADMLTGLSDKNEEYKEGE